MSITFAAKWSDNHNRALKKECKAALKDKEYLSYKECRFEKYFQIQDYGYISIERLNDSDLQRIVQSKCTVYINLGVFEYNRCLERYVNQSLGITKEPIPNPPVEYVPNPENPEENIIVEIEPEVKSELGTKSQAVKMNPHEVYQNLVSSVMLIKMVSLNDSLTDKENDELINFHKCSAVAVSNNLYATNYHCVAYPRNEGDLMSNWILSDYICLLSLDDDITTGTPANTANNDDFFEKEYGKCSWTEIVDTDPYADIATIRVKDDSVKLKSKAVNLKFSKDTKIFEEIYTLGNPGGVPGVFTKGKITAIGLHDVGGLYERPAKVYTIDALIEGGNSGGGLFDNEGSLIGITSAGDPERMGNKSLVQYNYAISIDEYRDLIK
tara:strand:- start:558 stop:1703 length:1146 start_codon:yes stop_codon:yes gene_type:complete